MNTRSQKQNGFRHHIGGGNVRFPKAIALFLLFSMIMLDLAGVSTFSFSTTVSAQEANMSPESLNTLIPLIISEFRVRGPQGANDEFIEIYNNSDSPHTVAGGGSGYGIVADDGLVRVTIPNGTVIPARGHFLGTNSVGYSLGASVPGDASFTTDIPDQSGIALFNNNVVGGFTLANRLDAVGPVTEANSLYKEGTGLPFLTPLSIDYSWTRIQNNGCNPDLKNTNNNVADFLFVDTNGTPAGAGQRLGAPGPQNLASAVNAHPGVTGLTQGLVDSGLGRSLGVNAIRDFNSVPANVSTFGSIDVRHKFINTTGVPITKLRFRITDLSTFPAPVGIADLRPISSSDTIVAISPGGGGGTAILRGTTLDQVPSQPNGGGFNSTLSVPFITAAAPLAAGASINIHFLFGIQQTGLYHYSMSTEALPVGDKNITLMVRGATDSLSVDEPCSNNMRHADFDGDGKSEISLFRDSVGSWYSLNSSDGALAQYHFGQSGDQVVPGDYDGDGITDYAVWRSSTSTWYIQRSTQGFTYFQFGLPTDLPAQGDFDGDGRTDIAVFRPSTGTWYLQQSSAGFAAVQFGASGDKPVVGDYDGDGKADIAVFRPSTGSWYMLKSAAGFVGVQFGVGTDKVVPADYDGDGVTDIAVYRGATGVWYLLESSNGFKALGFGLNGDIPAPADFDLDGKADLAVFRPSTGTWYRQGSATGFTASQFGQNGDEPVPAGYVPVQ